MKDYPKIIHELRDKLNEQFKNRVGEPIQVRYPLIEEIDKIQVRQDLCDINGDMRTWKQLEDLKLKYIHKTAEHQMLLEMNRPLTVDEICLALNSLESK